MVLEEGYPLYASLGGVHHPYANAKALRGYQTGKFPDGSVIVFDLLDAHTSGGALVTSERKVVGAMVKNGPKYAATGGWSFQGFKGESKIAAWARMPPKPALPVTWLTKITTKSSARHGSDGYSQCSSLIAASRFGALNANRADKSEFVCYHSRRDGIHRFWLLARAFS